MCSGSSRGVTAPSPSRSRHAKPSSIVLPRKASAGGGPPRNGGGRPVNPSSGGGAPRGREDAASSDVAAVSFAAAGSLVAVGFGMEGGAAAALGLFGLSGFV